jgi:hypothetical protein
MASYNSKEKYAALVSALVNVERCPLTGKIDENDIRIILGEYGDVWPASILPTSDGGCVVLAF